MNRCGADRLDARPNDGQSFAEHVAAMDQRFQEVDLHWSQVAATQQLISLALDIARANRFCCCV